MMVAHVSCVSIGLCVHVSERIREGEREVFQGGSGLTAGYNRDTPNSRLSHTPDWRWTIHMYMRGRKRGSRRAERIKGSRAIEAARGSDRAVWRSMFYISLIDNAAQDEHRAFFFSCSRIKNTFLALFFGFSQDSHEVRLYSKVQYVRMLVQNLKEITRPAFPWCSAHMDH